MRKSIKYLVSASFVATCVIGASSLASCAGNKGHNVTFHATEGHTINGVQDYTCKNCTNIDYEYSPDPKDGYSFVGWYDNDQYTGDIVTFPKTVSCDLNFYAKYNSVEGVNTVTFVTDGTKVPTYQVNKLDSIKTEPITTKEDYDFVAWKDKNDKAVTFPYTPTQNETLTASWKHTDKYHLILHTNGGSQPQKTELVQGETDVYKTIDAFKKVEVAPSTTKSDHSLKEWQYEDGNKVDFSKPLELTKDIDIYAIWKSNTTAHTATFKYYDSSTQTEEEIGKITDCSYIAYEPQPSQFSYLKSHYDFDGWYKETALSTKVDFTNGLSISDDIVLYAKFVPATTIKVTLYDDDTTTQIGDPIIYDIGDTIYAPFNYSGKKSAYCNLDGWYTESSYATKLEYPHTFTSSEAGTFNLYAKTSRTSANVQIINTEDDSVIATLGNIETLDTMPNVTISGRKEDYVCTALCTDKACGTSISYPYKIANVDESLITNNTLTLYAKWSRKYRITLIYGTGYTPERTVMEHQLSTISPSQLTKTACEDPDLEITEWKDSKGNVYDSSSTTALNLTADETFTAKWDYTHRTITVKNWEGTSSTYKHMPVSLNLSDISVIKSKPNYTLIGYKFNGTECLFSKVSKVSLVETNNFEEIWERSSCVLTIEYGYGITNKVIENQSLTFHPADLPLVTVQDYTLIGFSYNGTTYYLDGENEITVNSDAATVMAVYKQTGFTVTFNYNYGDTPTTHVVEHCSKLTSENIPNPTRDGYRFLGWSKSAASGSEVISLVDTDVTANALYYAQWEQTSTTFTVTFNVGSLQAAACFTDGTKIKKYENRTEGLSYDDCPKCTCFGNAFLGWFTADTGGEEVTYPLSKTQTVYAHWAPEKGYKTLTLTLEYGKFKDTSANTTLLTVKEDTTKWSEVSGSIPTIEFDDAFKVSKWTTTKGDISTAVTEDTTFSADTTLYSYLEDDVKTPSDFATDNWPTVCAVAENVDKKYSTGSGLDALKAIYKKTTFIGETRTVKFDGTEYTVRVVGEGQDYGSEDMSKKLPLTFEFVQSVYTDKFKTDLDELKWSNSTLHDKLNEDGSTYLLMQSSLIYNNHISTVYKATGERESTEGTTSKSVICANKLFVPSVYELNISDDYINHDNQFIYEQYKSATDTDRIKIFATVGGAANYYCRDYYCTSGGDNCIAYIKHDGSLHNTKANIGRPIAPFFCIGTAY